MLILMRKRMVRKMMEQGKVKKQLANLTRMMLNAVDKKLSKAERSLWEKQANFTAKRIEGLPQR